jgi:hypothetical protein
MASTQRAIGMTTIALVVAAVVIIAAVGAFVISGQLNAKATNTSHPTSSSTTSTVSNNNTFSSCGVNFMSSGGYLHLVADSTEQPLSGITVEVSPIANSTCYVHGAPTAYITNASGWVSTGALPGGAYFEVSLQYAGRGYSFSIPQVSLDVTTVTLGLPSGSLDATECYMAATPPSCAILNQTATISTNTSKT